MSPASSRASQHKTRARLRHLSFALLLVVAVFAACGGPAAGPTTPTSVPPAATSTPVAPEPTPTQPAAPSIAGMVIGDDDQPLFAIADQEVLIVALVCPDGQGATRCFPNITAGMDFDGLYASICDSADTSVCTVSLGRGAALVGPDGRFALADVPPGSYGLVLLYSFPDLGGYSERGYSIKRDIVVPQSGTSTGHTFTLLLHRE